MTRIVPAVVAIVVIADLIRIPILLTPRAQSRNESPEYRWGKFA